MTPTPVEHHLTHDTWPPRSLLDFDFLSVYIYFRYDHSMDQTGKVANS